MCQVRVFHKWVRWKLWQISIKFVFLNIRVGIRVRGLHLVVRGNAIVSAKCWTTFESKFSGKGDEFVNHELGLTVGTKKARVIPSFYYIIPNAQDFISFDRVHLIVKIKPSLLQLIPEPSPGPRCRFSSVLGSNENLAYKRTGAKTPKSAAVEISRKAGGPIPNPDLERH